MKTTVDLPDDLLAQAKAAAAQRRTTLKAMIEHALRREIAGVQSSSGAKACFELDGAGLPVIKKTNRTRVTSEMVYQMMEDLGV